MEQREFLQKERHSTIKLENIILTEKIHIDEKKDFKYIADMLQEKGLEDTYKNTLTVRPLFNKEGKYALVSGYKAYCVYEFLEKEEVDVVITSAVSRREHFGRLKVAEFEVAEDIFDFIDFKFINISNKFKRSRPKRHKVDKFKEMIKNNKLNKAIVLDVGDYIVDGYAKYVAFKELGYTHVPVRFNYIGYEGEAK